ncbi:MAG: GNAT family N-acetyltransferase [Chloroflexota bacterium]|nr:GNAT family N-acetyltransferase [Chloroflexota bacterium]
MVVANPNVVLRRASPADVDAVAEFNSRLHDDSRLGIWTRDAMSGRHPTMNAASFLLAVERRTDQIVSLACLIPQTWTYDGIALTVGQIETVGTDPDYRRQGLTRAIIEALHRESEENGHLVQAILGNPWWYRRFGYEYALTFGGRRHLELADLEALAEKAHPRFQVRPAETIDIPALSSLYQQQCAGKLLVLDRDRERWHFDLTGHSPGSLFEARNWLLQDHSESTAGFFRTLAPLFDGRLVVTDLVAEKDVGLSELLPTICQSLQHQLSDEVVRLTFDLGMTHPAYQALEEILSALDRPYAWYVRVPDLPALVNRIKPVLERRLADAGLSDLNESLCLSFYEDGLRMKFEKGRLAEVVSQPGEDQSDAAFPPLVFLKLLFSYRSLAELLHAFPDCWATPQATEILNVLFPRRISWVQSMG